jgi:hypothetical protein
MQWPDYCGTKRISLSVIMLNLLSASPDCQGISTNAYLNLNLFAATTAASFRLAAIEAAETKGKPVAVYSSIVITKRIIPYVSEGGLVRCGRGSWPRFRSAHSTKKRGSHCIARENCLEPGMRFCYFWRDKSKI